MLHRILLFLLVLPLSQAVVTVQAADAPPKVEPERLKLWNGRAPTGGGKFEQGDARITVYKPEKGNGTAIVICPGGGYGGLAVEPEGHGIARWLNRHGITGIVLEYRMPAGRSHVPLLDAQRAVRSVRGKAMPGSGKSTRRRSASWDSRRVVIWLRRPGRISTTATPKPMIPSSGSAVGRISWY